MAKLGLFMTCLARLIGQDKVRISLVCLVWRHLESSIFQLATNSAWVLDVQYVEMTEQPTKAFVTSRMQLAQILHLFWIMVVLVVTMIWVRMKYQKYFERWGGGGGQSIPSRLPYPLESWKHNINIYFLESGCTKICPPKEQPVCASNKVTYANRCEFENAACSSVDLRFVSIGPCGRKKFKWTMNELE